VRPLLLAGLVALSACQSFRPPPEVEGGPEIALRRYDGWSSARVKPPYMVGPDVSIKLAKGELRGTMAGLLTSLRFEKDGVTGMISGQAVEIDVARATGEIDLEGTWFGRTVRLIATDDRIRATVPSPRGGCCWDYAFQRREHGAQPGTVLYVDEHHGSTYTGSGAVLELPQQMLGWFSTAEVAVLLLVFLFASG
jgi:hypothetical protein